MSSKFVHAKWARFVKNVRADTDREAANRHGLSLGDYDAAVSSHLRRLQRDGELAIRMWPEEFAAIHESGGRLRHSTLSSRRRNLENEVFVQGPPIYGYLAEPNEPSLDLCDRDVYLTGPGTTFYGSVKLILRPDVRRRTTALLGDFQMDVADEQNLGLVLNVPAPLSEPNVLSCLPHIEPLVWQDVGPLQEFGGDSYFEIHVHGGLSLADVARVVVIDKTDEAGQVAAVAASAGIPCEIPDVYRLPPAGMIPDWTNFVLLVHNRPAHESPIHGDQHWRCVAHNGLRLANETPGVNHRVVLLFALLHDAFRESDGDDPEHGTRAANAAWALREYLSLAADELGLLLCALADHDAGRTSEDPTIGCCWDSDRLELPRVGIAVGREYLSTDAGLCLTDERRLWVAPSWRTLYLRAALAWHQTKGTNVGSLDCGSAVPVAAA